MSIHRRTALSAATCALVPSLSWALNLGEMHGQTLINQPLAARIEIYASSSELASSTSVTVLPDLFNSARDDAALILSSIHAEVVRNETGYAFVQVKSVLPLTASPVDFRLRIQLGEVALVRRYSLQAQSAPLPRTAPIRRDKRVQQRSIAASDSQIGMPGHYGPVRAGESLWSIARRLGARDMQSLMSQIYAANPEAFAHGDRAQLKQGVTLVLPVQGNRISQVTAGVPAPISAPPPELAPRTPNEVSAAPKIESIAHSASSTPTTSLSDPTLAARLAKLEEKFAAIRALYGVEKKSQALSADERQQRSKPTLAEKKAPPKTTASTSSPGASSAPAIAAASTVTNRPISLRILLLGVITLAVLVGFGWLFSKTQARRRALYASSLRADDDELKAAVTVKAEQRLRERELAVTNDASEFETTLSAVDFESIVAMPEGDDVYHEIDVNITHGRYVEAERLLHEVVKAAPQNIEAKTRLAEVYYITEKVAEFANTAAELQTKRAELRPGEWQRIVRMGKMIAPDMALFENSAVQERRAS